jgi:hypothetical protein
LKFYKANILNKILNIISSPNSLNFSFIISDMPQDSVIRILERIKPDYMQCLVGKLHIKKLLSTQEDDPIRILTEFIREHQWKQFPEVQSKLIIPKKTDQSLKKAKSFFDFLNKKCKELSKQKTSLSAQKKYAKLDHNSLLNKDKYSLNDVVNILYVTLNAFLDAYSVQNMQDTLDLLNEQIQNGTTSENYVHSLPEYCSYTVTEDFIKKYRTIYQTLKELMLLLQEMKNNETLPDIFKVFDKIGLLGM